MDAKIRRAEREGNYALLAMLQAKTQDFKPLAPCVSLVSFSDLDGRRVFVDISWGKQTRFPVVTNNGISRCLGVMAPIFKPPATH